MRALRCTALGRCKYRDPLKPAALLRHPLGAQLNECGGRLDEAEAAQYFGQLLEAVRYIHGLGLAHRGEAAGCLRLA